MAPARTPNRRTRSDVATRNGLLAAWGLFTVLPAPVVAEVDERLAVRAIASMPWVGLGLGLIAGLGCAIVTVAGAASRWQSQQAWQSWPCAPASCTSTDSPTPPTAWAPASRPTRP